MSPPCAHLCDLEPLVTTQVVTLDTLEGVPRRTTPTDTEYNSWNTSKDKCNTTDTLTSPLAFYLLVVLFWPIQNDAKKLENDLNTLRVLSEGFPMNTNMTGFRWFWKHLHFSPKGESSISMEGVSKQCSNQYHSQHSAYAYLGQKEIKNHTISPKCLGQEFLTCPFQANTWRFYFDINSGWLLTMYFFQAQKNIYCAIKII